MKINNLLVFAAGLFLVAQSCSMDDDQDEELKIPTVITVAISDITSISAICTVNVVSFGKTKIGVYAVICSYTEAEPTDLGASDAYTDSAGIYTVKINGLVPGTAYYARAYAWNSYGTAYGDVLTFSTTGSLTGEPVFNQDLVYDTVSDVEGNVYKTIRIGNQTWMAENLKTTKYNDSTTIPQVTYITQWKNLQTPAYCWFLNDGNKYKSTFGALYNWWAVNTGKLCPVGWHVPSDAEWTTLSEFLGDFDTNGWLPFDTIPYRHLRETGTEHWVDTISAGTNSTGFTALPAGARFADSHAWYDFNGIGYGANFWSSTKDQSYHMPFYRFLGYVAPGNGWGGGSVFSKYGANASSGFSVRCVKD